MTTWQIDVVTTPGLDHVEEIVGEFDIPCELGIAPNPECDHPAHWVMWTVDHGHGGRARLACDACKEFRMTTEDAVYCQVCNFVTAPARHAYTRVEPLHRTP